MWPFKKKWYDTKGYVDLPRKKVSIAFQISDGLTGIVVIDNTGPYCHVKVATNRGSYLNREIVEVHLVD